MWAVLEADQGLRRRSWERIRAYRWEVLGADQGRSGRSWGRIRAYVSGLGRGSGPIVVQTQAGGRSWNGIGPESRPNPSGTAIQKGRAARRGKGRIGPISPQQQLVSRCSFVTALSQPSKGKTFISLINPMSVFFVFFCFLC